MNEKERSLHVLAQATAAVEAGDSLDVVVVLTQASSGMATVLWSSSTLMALGVLTVAKQLVMKTFNNAKEGLLTGKAGFVQGQN